MYGICILFAVVMVAACLYAVNEDKPCTRRMIRQLAKLFRLEVEK